MASLPHALHRLLASPASRATTAMKGPLNHLAVQRQQSTSVVSYRTDSRKTSQLLGIALRDLLRQKM